MQNQLTDKTGTVPCKGCKRRVRHADVVSRDGLPHCWVCAGVTGEPDLARMGLEGDPSITS